MHAVDAREQYSSLFNRKYRKKYNLMMKSLWNNSIFIKDKYDYRINVIDANADNYTYRFETKFFFDINEDLKAAESIIKSFNFKIERITKPEYYSVIIIDPSYDKNNVIRKLKNIVPIL